MAKPNYQKRGIHRRQMFLTEYEIHLLLESIDVNLGEAMSGTDVASLERLQTRIKRETGLLGVSFEGERVLSDE